MARCVSTSTGALFLPQRFVSVPEIIGLNKQTKPYKAWACWGRHPCEERCGGGAALPLPAGLGEPKTDLKAQVWARIGVLEQGRLRLVKKKKKQVCGGHRLTPLWRQRGRDREEKHPAASPGGRLSLSTTNTNREKAGKQPQNLNMPFNLLIFNPNGEKKLEKEKKCVFSKPLSVTKREERTPRPSQVPPLKAKPPRLPFWGVF